MVLVPSQYTKMCKKLPWEMFFNFYLKVHDTDQQA